MTVKNLFDLFLLRKVTILFLLILFNIVAFFAYDLVSMNHQIRLKMEFPISVEQHEVVEHSYFSHKFTEGSVMRNVLKEVNQTRYKLTKDNYGDYFNVMFTCDIKEDCITGSKLLLEALNNEAKVIIDSKEIINEIKVSQFKDSIKTLKNKRESVVNKRNVLISTQQDYFELSKENIDEANNLDNLNTMLLLESINDSRQKASSELAELDIGIAGIDNSIYTTEKAIEYFSTLTKIKHLFKWLVEPSIKNVSRKLSFSLWLTLSFLMSIALYFLAAIVSIAFIKDDGHSYVLERDKSAT